MARIPTRIPGGLLVVTVVLPFSLALGTVTAHAAAPLGQGALRTSRALAPGTPEVRDPQLAERRHLPGERPGLFGLPDAFGATGIGDLASDFTELPGQDALPGGPPRPHHPAKDTAGPPRPHVPPHKPHRPPAPTPPAPPAPGSAAPHPPAPPTHTPAPPRTPDDRPASATPHHEAAPSHHPTHRRPAAPPHRPKRVPVSVPRPVPAEEPPAPSSRTVQEADDHQAPDAQAEPQSDGSTYPFAGTGTHAERVLPMGAGMALTGLGLAFLGLRLRRG
ncbi:hypothetical protein [Streptomyces catenulae]|uniref:Gram-positive cocci surface proteins LPxTG domain-containing protein n=1 Tax=Streptomyces catenulae TaxID=66875 RepID=A0ABV2YX70_9ACTN